MKKLNRISISKKIVMSVVALVLPALLLIGAGQPHEDAHKHVYLHKADRAHLGVNIEDVPEKELEKAGITHGVRVVKVAEDTAAKRAGIKEGDIILYFNGEETASANDLVRAVKKCKPGDKVTAKVLRGKKQKKIDVTVGKLDFNKLGLKHLDKLKHLEKLKHLGKLEGLKGLKVLASSPKAFLGVRIEGLKPDLADYFGVKPGGGVLVMDVVKDSPAQKAGLKAGDVIVKLNEKAVSDPKEVTEAIADLKEGDRVALNVVRHKKKKKFTAVLEKGKGLRHIELLGLGEQIHKKLEKSLKKAEARLRALEGDLGKRLEKAEEKLKRLEEAEKSKH